MSHALELDTNGNAKAFFVGETPWHGLGVILQKPPTVEEGIKLAQLDWTVKLKPLRFEDTGADHSDAETYYKPLPGYFATVRDNDKRPLGVVGSKYVPLQNIDAFKWFQPFLDSGAVTLEAAGSLHEGAKVWVLARVAEKFGGAAEVVDGDRLDNFILLANGHDGQTSVRTGFTTVRVVCQNTLSAALNGSKATNKLLKIRHTSAAPVALSLVRDIIDLSRREFQANVDVYRILAATGCDERILKRYVREVYEPGTREDDEAIPRIVEQVCEYFRGGRGNQFGKDTLWNAYNAITEHISHGTGKDRANRLDSQWFGRGAGIIQRALRVALEVSADPKAF